MPELLAQYDLLGKVEREVLLQEAESYRQAVIAEGGTVDDEGYKQRTIRSERAWEALQERHLADINAFAS